MTAQTIGVDITVCDIRPTELGEVLYIYIKRRDGAAMSFREVYDAFASAYPGRYAVQVLPPRERLFDSANKYHLFVLPAKPCGLDLFDPPPHGAHAPTEDPWK